MLRCAALRCTLRAIVSDIAIAQRYVARHIATYRIAHYRSQVFRNAQRSAAVVETDLYSSVTHYRATL